MSNIHLIFCGARVNTLLLLNITSPLIVIDPYYVTKVGCALFTKISAKHKNCSTLHSWHFASHAFTCLDHMDYLEWRM